MAPLQGSLVRRGTCLLDNVQRPCHAQKGRCRQQRRSGNVAEHDSAGHIRKQVAPSPTSASQQLLKNRPMEYGPKRSNRCLAQLPRSNHSLQDKLMSSCSFNAPQSPVGADGYHSPAACGNFDSFGVHAERPRLDDLTAWRSAPRFATSHGGVFGAPTP